MRKQQQRVAIIESFAMKTFLITIAFSVCSYFLKKYIFLRFNIEIQIFPEGFT